MNSGLQSQRTELAWLRTTISSWAVAVLAARIDVRLLVLAVAGPVAVTLVAHGRRRRLREEDVPPALAAAQAVPMAAACALAALAMALLLL